MEFSIFSERTALLDLQSSVASSQSSEITAICRFLSEQASLHRFTRASFLPAETKFNIGEGSTYRVDIAQLSRDQPELVAVKNVKSNNGQLGAVLHELRIQTHEPLRQCPNLVVLKGYGWEVDRDQVSPYLVMEYSSFGTLTEFLSLRKGSVSFQEKAWYCRDVARGLEALHSCNIAHGDVKMENTLVFAISGTDSYIVKLSDFGHAIINGNTRYLGTELLSAPEVRKQELGGLQSLAQHFKCDIFSYGLLVWEALQDGQRYQNLKEMNNPAGWLNNLPKDELLRLALLALYRVGSTAITVALRVVLQNIFKATLRDNPEDRASIKELIILYGSVVSAGSPEE